MVQFNPIIKYSEKFCMWGFKSQAESRYFLGFKIVLGFIFPLIIIIFCYLRILSTVRRSEKNLHNGIEKKQSNASSRTERAIAVVISVFFCTWLPSHVFNFGKKFFGHFWSFLTSAFLADGKTLSPKVLLYIRDEEARIITL